MCVLWALGPAPATFVLSLRVKVSIGHIRGPQGHIIYKAYKGKNSNVIWKI